MIKEPNDLVSLSVDQMTHKRGVPTFIHHEVTRIDRGAQTVTVRNLDNGEVFERPYDKLVIATGARPIVPRIPGTDANGVYTLRTVEDGIRLKSVVQSGAQKKAAIIGGGFGYAIKTAISQGAKRGLFSNEAGERFGPLVRQRLPPAMIL